ncbi:MAG: hypothetical protein LPK45_01525 [Bacteroidota bacterium]|nr:hypothetical protein [Bacteroidota bacterium]MDX5429713.1 hypothetical protein [Bacteroidota bacterium]MDX5468494.1 hypothetical protein [Bacteroidota bacterium]
MHKSLIILSGAFFFLLILGSCSKAPVKNGEPALIIGDPLNIGMEDVLIFPVGVNYYQPNETRVVIGNSEPDATTRNKLSFNQREYGLADNNAKKEYFNPNEEDQDIRNILFYNLNERKSKPLFNDSLHILSFAIHHEFARPCIFYRMVRNDLNGDGKYNSYDPVMLYVSNLEGDSLVAVTPENERYLEYFYYPKQSLILVKTMVDADQDSMFTQLDETNMREVNLLAPAMGREIFEKDLKEDLRNMLK